MFTKRSESAEHLDRAIIELQEELIKNDLPDKDWNQKFDRLHQLTLLREKPNSVSPDTVAIIGANLIGLIMILSYEKTGIITSKSVQYIAEAW